MRYGIKFEKGWEIKFTGHLDLLKIFQRAVNRARLPVAYSQGFNPHQLLTLASPLALGTTSRGEYGEIELLEALPEEGIVRGLSAVMPRGLRIIKVFPLKPGEKIGMGSIAAASYEIWTGLPEDTLRRRLPEFIARKEILISKKTKKGFRETNIREDIFGLGAEGDGKLSALLASGSERNLKPELLAEALFGFLGAGFDRYRLVIHRTELYRRSVGGGFVPLDAGEGSIETSVNR